MSWGFAEGQAVLAADEALYDSDLTTPAGHQGVTFVASTGDYGTADPEYPAFSPNVVAVGGTSLNLNGDDSYSSETGWGYDSNVRQRDGSFGSGGGVSQFEAEPAFQTGRAVHRLPHHSRRVAGRRPDTGAWIADTYNLPRDNPWASWAAPACRPRRWAGLIALANQGRGRRPGDAQFVQPDRDAARRSTTCRIATSTTSRAATTAASAPAPATTLLPASVRPSSTS